MRRRSELTEITGARESTRWLWPDLCRLQPVAKHWSPLKVCGGHDVSLAAGLQQPQALAVWTETRPVQ